jgi:hypothetical protein
LSVQNEQTLAEKEMDSLKKEIFVPALATGKVIPALLLPIIDMQIGNWDILPSMEKIVIGKVTPLQEWIVLLDMTNGIGNKYPILSCFSINLEWRELIFHFRHSSNNY